MCQWFGCSWCATVADLQFFSQWWDVVCMARLQNELLDHLGPSCNESEKGGELEANQLTAPAEKEFWLIFSCLTFHVWQSTNSKVSQKSFSAFPNLTFSMAKYLMSVKKMLVIFKVSPMERCIRHTKQSPNEPLCLAVNFPLRMSIPSAAMISTKSMHEKKRKKKCRELFNNKSERDKFLSETQERTWRKQ